MSEVFTDPRDREVYKTVEIDGQTWLAENLRYRSPVKKIDGWTIEEKDFYYPPNGEWKNLQKYGCLYTWNNALKAVPEGWHLPSKEEFEELLRMAGSSKEKRLEALSSKNWNGNDNLGFSALPAGYEDHEEFNGFNMNAIFWSSTSNDDWNSYCLSLGNVNALRPVADYYAFSVRCIKD